MTEVLGDYAAYVARVEAEVNKQGIRSDELVQCDMLNIECSTNENYDNAKAALLARSAEMLSEIEHGGRLISIFGLDPALQAGSWRIPHVELLQPKPTRENIDGIDGIFFVTARGLGAFLEKHNDIAFEDKGLANRANPYVELKGETDGAVWAVKFHDRHMGAVLGIEQLLGEA